MTHALTDSQLLTIWERGMALGMTERALLAMCTADADLPAHEARAWPLGQRDARLLDVRHATFGSRARFCADCPRCHAKVEFDVRTQDMRRDVSAVASLTIDIDELRVIARAPDSDDVMAAERASSEDQAVELLWRRCVRVVALDGTEIDIAALNPAQRAIVESRLDEADPQTDVAFELKCVACGASWVAPCDVARLLWDEIAAAARAVFQQIGTLARGFGWTESQILRLSRRRRELYWEMLG